MAKIATAISLTTLFLLSGISVQPAESSARIPAKSSTTGSSALGDNRVSQTHTDIPPVHWGEEGRRENMIETASSPANRWRQYGNTPLPDPEYATHGPLVPAFPGAEGYGAYSFGGRGGTVYRVTNLDNSGPGSLRRAAQASGPRIIVFDVSGTIELTTPIRVYHPYMTIAGQTAPGDGITVAGQQFDVRTHDVVIRHMRFRHGNDGRYSDDEWTLRVRGANYVVLDHVTATWGVDGNLGVTHSDNITVQNSMLAKPLYRSVHEKGNRAYGALVRGRHGARYSFLANLWTNHRARVPRPGNYVPFLQDPDGLQIDFRNNVMLDGVGANYDDDTVTKYNFVNNYALTNWRLIEQSRYSQGYFEGNFRQGSIPADQYSMVQLGGNISRSDHEQSEPFDPGPVTTRSAHEAWEFVSSEAGAWPRDEHDTYVLQELVNYHAEHIEGSEAPYSLPAWWRTGRIDHQDEVGGLPNLETARLPADSNQNGIPDWWEEEHGLDSSDPDLAVRDDNGNGYTNIEDYLNWLANPDGLFLDRHPRYGGEIDYVPQPPDLIQPHQHAANVDLSPHFLWSTSESSDQYQLRIYEGINAERLVVDTTLAETGLHYPGELQPNETYTWAVRGISPDGEPGIWSSSRMFFTRHVTSAGSEEAVTEYRLDANYPNPFNPSTLIGFAIPERGHVTLEVFDLTGRRVATLVDETREVGHHTVTFDASQLTSGVYLYRMQTDRFVTTRKLTLIK
ncbi:T9SS type A sorting domain-containing protein [Balneolales bacterium ANBcel1]|nr:T9SS type A sorting domain-containing protein [Balneolales bacterium ANBcel1]